MNITDIKRIFEEEFSNISGKFEFIELRVTEAGDSKADYVWHPGVYLWWHPERGVVKVGRHLTNSRKRALEHVRANTGGVIKALANDPETKVLLFNVRDPNHHHWVAALEVFFEKQLNPTVRSGRLG